MEREKVYVVLDIGAYGTTVLGVFKKKSDAVACFEDNREMNSDTDIEEHELIN